MKVTVKGETYDIRFRHEQMPGGDVRVGPKYHDLAGALIQADMTINGYFYGQDERVAEFKQNIRGLVKQYLGSATLVSHITTCSVYSNEMIITTGAAVCDKRDQFSRPMGRAISLIKAVRSLPRSTWEPFFQGYFESGVLLPGLNDLRVAIGKEWADAVPAFFMACRATDVILGRGVSKGAA